MPVPLPVPVPGSFHEVQKDLEGLARVADRFDIFVRTGAGSPETVVTAPVGTLYLRRDGGATTTLYVKTSGSGNTGWTAK